MPLLLAAAAQKEKEREERGGTTVIKKGGRFCCFCLGCSFVLPNATSSKALLQAQVQATAHDDMKRPEGR